MRSMVGNLRDELVGVPLRVKLGAFQVFKGGVNHSDVQKQSFCPGAAIGHLTADAPEPVHNRNARVREALPMSVWRPWRTCFGWRLPRHSERDVLRIRR